ncbi:hypothetical protein JXQ70_13095 [bacterium]|nr:hypothetical protein [bacterium]
MSLLANYKLIEVPWTAKQVRDIQWLQSWVEPSIWSLRMLVALVTGVKGGKWYSLMDKKLRGRSRGIDHQRWPNAYFGELGLYSLRAAWEKAYQSVKR